jgi:uncharacterized membrane protein YkoI
MKRVIPPTAALLLALSALPSPASDHDRAREALERGEILPMSQILARVETQMPGEVIEVELEREHGRLVYELKVLAPNGRVSEVLVDAATAEILGLEHD